MIEQMITFTFVDTYGHPVKVGDFVALSDNGRIICGTVTSINTLGENVSIKTNTDEEIIRRWSNQVMVIDDKLKNRVMIEKLEIS